MYDTRSMIPLQSCSVVADAVVGPALASSRLAGQQHQEKIMIRPAVQFGSIPSDGQSSTSERRGSAPELLPPSTMDFRSSLDIGLLQC